MAAIRILKEELKTDRHKKINGTNNKQATTVWIITRDGIENRMILYAYQPVIIEMIISVIMLAHAAPFSAR